MSESLRLDESESGALLDIQRASDAAVARLRPHADAAAQAFQGLKGKPFSHQDLTDVYGGLSGDNLTPVMHQVMGPYTDAIKRMPEEARKRWEQIHYFLGHDMGHVNETEIVGHSLQVASTLMGITMAKDDAKREDVFMFDTPYPPELLAFYERVIDETAELSAQTIRPHQFAKALAEMDRGDPVSDMEDVALAPMIRTMARSLQLRFVFDDYEMDDIVGNPGRNQICLDLADARVKTNPGMLWSVIYNLMKNAAKELSVDKQKRRESDLFERLKDGTLPEQPKRLYVKADSLPNGTVLVHVCDTGRGLRADEILGSLKEMLAKKLVEPSALPLPARVSRLLAGWQEGKAFAVRDLRMGDVYDFAALSRVSGFSTEKRVKASSSGLGLWGAKFLTERMGASLLYTNTFDDGALFSVVLPREPADPPRKRLSAAVRGVRDQLLSGALKPTYKAA